MNAGLSVVVVSAGRQIVGQTIAPLWLGQDLTRCAATAGDKSAAKHSVISQTTKFHTKPLILTVIHEFDSEFMNNPG